MFSSYLYVNFLSLRFIFLTIFFLLFLSFLLFLFLEIKQQDKVKDTFLEQQKERQIDGNKKLADSAAQILKDIQAQLKSLANTQNLQEGDFTSNNTKNLLFSVFEDIRSIADRIVILDSNDVAVTDIHNPENPTVLGTDFSFRDFVQKTRTTGEMTISDGFIAKDGTFRIAINYPIVDQSTGKYLGMIGTRIGTIDFFSLFANTIDLTKDFISAYDENGNYLAGPLKDKTGHTLVGKNVFSKEFQEIITKTEGLGAFNRLLNDTIRTGDPQIVMMDIGFGPKLATSYPIHIHPINDSNKPQFFMNYVFPLSSLNNKLDKVFLFTIYEFILISGVTMMLSILLYYLLRNWSKELGRKIKQKAEELEEKSKGIEYKNKQLENQLAILKELNEKLYENDKNQKEFINIATHELRTPTQSVAGYMEMIELFPENIQEYLKPLKRNIDRLSNLIEDLLQVSKIENKTITLQKSKFDLVDRMKNIITDLTLNKNILNKSNTKIIFNLPKEPVMVYADRIRIYQLVTNLLINALKFTKDGKIVITVEKQYDRTKDKHEKGDKGFALVRVKDNGLGIDKTILNRLFEKFVTTTASGTGLGLYLAKSIVEEHGGTIRGYNNNELDPEESGATFEFTLPLK